MNKTPEELDLLKDIKVYADIKSAATSSGGKIIINALITDIVSAIAAIGNYKDLSHQEMIAVAAKLSVVLGLYKTLIGAETNQVALQKILKENFTPSFEE